MKLQIIIPIYQPDEKFKQLLLSIKKQSIKNIPVLILDSGSDDSWYREAEGLNLRVEKIDSRTFTHGGTRQFGIEQSPDADILIFLTQDAVPYDQDTIKNLVAVFQNDEIGSAFGRQIPNKDANIFASMARTFNYPPHSYIRGYEDRKQYGMKTVYTSNSFAAYRRTAMDDIGGFSSETIVSEDMYAAAKMVLQGWKIAYAADARVYHSHNYSLVREFRRYFDIGVFQASEPWIVETFGKAEGEGKRFLYFEIRSILSIRPYLIFSMVFRNMVQLLGYRCGLKERCLSKSIKKKISVNKSYW